MKVRLTTDLFFAALALTLAMPAAGSAQMARTRSQADGPVDATFKAARLIQLPTTKNFEAGTVNFTIMHSFGPVNGGIQELYGLDGGANIRFGLDYGVNKDLSVGIGRSRLDKVYDLRAKYVVMEQLRSDRIPVTVAVQSTAGIDTRENAFNASYSMVHRFNYSHLLMVSRKFSDRFSAQLTPAVVHFNRVPAGHPNTTVALGAAARFKLDARTALTGEYIPILSGRAPGARDGLNLGLEMETGGHVFQMFFTTGTGLTESYAIARNSDDFFASPFGAFRFGFNVHRIFWFE